jgi:hypothetical protein
VSDLDSLEKPAQLPFGTVPADAAPLERLVAFAGRQP